MTNEELKQYQSLDEILETASLTPLFQPIISTKKNKIYGYEALIRGPSDGPLHSPINLFDAASRHGRLAELDLLCREVAITQFGKLGINEKLFINTIPEVLLLQNYQYGLTLDFVKKAGLSAQQVVIELTEQFPIDDYTLMREATEHYRKMGFSIAIDDLGAGYSGLRTWSEIRPDFVKLDRHFMQGIHDDIHKRQFVQSMVDLAKSINCQVIGEGIEIREEYLTTLDMGVEFVQGYYFGRPTIAPLQHIDPQLFSKRKPHSYSKLSIARVDSLVQSLSSELEPAFFDDHVSSVGERFQKEASLPSIPVINNDNTVAGIIWRNDLMNLYASRYGREIYGNRPIRLFMDKNPLIVEESSSLEDLSHRIVNNAPSSQYSSFIITNNGYYSGIGSFIDLLKHITELQITTARHANPLSGLPGNVPISEKIMHALTTRQDIVVCYFDLDNFKPYNDTYGFSMGDKVIRYTAELLIRHSDPVLDFVGHIGGDDFIVLFESPDWDNKCKQILTEFSALHPKFYKNNHLKQRGVSAHDRHGNKVFFPLLSLSIGAIKIRDFDVINNEIDLAEHASKAKSIAKKTIGNSLYLLNNAD